jgi:hypothetical protein
MITAYLNIIQSQSRLIFSLVDKLSGEITGEY